MTRIPTLPHKTTGRCLQCQPCRLRDSQLGVIVEGVLARLRHLTEGQEARMLGDLSRTSDEGETKQILFALVLVLGLEDANVALDAYKRVVAMGPALPSIPGQARHAYRP